jgi:hypothetical protein
MALLTVADGRHAFVKAVVLPVNCIVPLELMLADVKAAP